MTLILNGEEQAQSVGGGVSSSPFGGLSITRNTALGIVGKLVKNSPGQLAGYYVFNPDTVTNYLKLYDSASIPTSGDTPVLTLPIPAGAGANLAFPVGVSFVAGIGMRATKNLADGDNTAPGSAMVVNIFYK